MNDLSSMDGILPTPHEYNKHIHMGSQWALFVPTHYATYIHNGTRCVQYDVHAFQIESSSTNDDGSGDCFGGLRLTKRITRARNTKAPVIR